MNYGPYIYDAATGLYFFEGMGMGYTLAEVEALEDGIEAHEIHKRARIAEAQEY